MFTGVLSVSAIGAKGTRDCGSGFLIAKEADVEGDERSGNHILGSLEAIIIAHLAQSQDMVMESLHELCRCLKFFTWAYLSLLPKYQDFWSISYWMQGVLLYMY
jgi:hypothetical protein